MKIAFIGGGNMGEAILAAMLGKKLATAKTSRQRYSGGEEAIPGTEIRGRGISE